MEQQSEQGNAATGMISADGSSSGRASAATKPVINEELQARLEQDRRLSEEARTTSD